MDSAAMGGATVTGKDTDRPERLGSADQSVFGFRGIAAKALVSRGGFRLRRSDVRNSDIDDLIEGVDRFAFAGATTENEDAGDKLVVGLAVVGLGSFGCIFFFAYKAGDADGLSAVAA